MSCHNFATANCMLVAFAAILVSVENSVARKRPRNVQDLIANAVAVLTKLDCNQLHHHYE